MKRPSFQFYPSDWLRDTALRACSLAAQGLWANLMCHMHTGAPYGCLTLNGAPMTDVQIAKAVGISVKEYLKLQGELDGAGVPSYTDQGVMFSRRMIRDEHLRNMRAGYGKLGGNPVLVGTKKDKPLLKPRTGKKVKPEITPSSSSVKAFTGSEISVSVPDHESPTFRPPSEADIAVRDAARQRLLSAGSEAGT